MDAPYGHLEGVVTKIDGKEYITFEVRAENGVVCFASDPYGSLQALEVGMKVCLEEANIAFDNGQIVYIVDEYLCGVSINEVCIENFVPKKRSNT